MFCKPYDEKDGMKVWLDEREVRQFLNAADGSKQKTAFTLGVRSGLRVHEIVAVTPQDVVTTSAGPRVRVTDGKGGKYRETPTTAELYHTAQSAVEYGGLEPDDPLVDKDVRTVRRWVTRAADELAEETGDENWRHVGPHDLRRTWATLLSGSEVDPLLVCDWGGWDDLETFLEHYRGSYSPQVQRRELEKVSWLDGESAIDETRDPETALLEEADA